MAAGVEREGGTGAVEGGGRRAIPHVLRYVERAGEKGKVQFRNGGDL